MKNALTDYFDVKNGYSFTSSEQLSERDSNSLEIFKQGHIEIGGGLRTKPKRAFVKMSEKLQKFKLEKGDIVLAMTDMKDNVVILGVPAMIDESEKYVLNQRVAWLKPKEKTTTKFFYYQMLNTEFLEELRSKANSGVQVNLSVSHIKEMQFWTPPLQEQQSISEVLSSIDDKIDLLNRNNRTLEEMAETLFRQWFVEFKFPNDDNSNNWQHRKMKPSDHGLIPENWNYGTISDITRIIETGRRPKGGVGLLNSGVPSIGAENVKKIGYYNFEKTKFISEDYYQKMNSGKLENRDILIYKDGGVPGTFIPHFSMVGEGFPYSKMAINEHVFRVVAKESYFQNYLFFWLNTELTVSELAERGTGAAIPGINSTQLKSTPCLIPDKETVFRFDEIAEPLVQKILKNSSQIKKMGILRDTLLPKLMSGQVRVQA